MNRRGAGSYHDRKRLVNTVHWLPPFAWQRLTRSILKGKIHLIFALPDHGEPADPWDGQPLVPHPEKVRRCREFPRVVDRWRGHVGSPYANTYFYPAEQYDWGRIEQLELEEHCKESWGENEVHLHHGTEHTEVALNR